MNELQQILARNPELEVVGEPIERTAVNKQWQHEKNMAKAEEATQTLLLQLGDSVPKPVREYKFLKDRRHHFDLAWPEHRVYAEIEGGIYQKTKTGYSKGHAHPVRFQEDCEKYSLASVHGWLGIRGSIKQVESGDVAKWIKMLFKERFDYVVD